MFILTHRLVLSVVVMIGSNVYTAVGYYFYERVWNKIKWGRKYKSVKVGRK